MEGGRWRSDRTDILLLLTSRDVRERRGRSRSECSRTRQLWDSLRLLTRPRPVNTELARLTNSFLDRSMTSKFERFLKASSGMYFRETLFRIIFVICPLQFSSPLKSDSISTFWSSIRTVPVWSSVSASHEEQLWSFTREIIKTAIISNFILDWSLLLLYCISQKCIVRIVDRTELNNWYRWTDYTGPCVLL